MTPILTAYHAAKSGAPLSELDEMLSSALPYRRPAIKAAIIRGTIDHLRESGVPETDAMLAGLVGVLEGVMREVGLHRLGNALCFRFSHLGLRILRGPRDSEFAQNE